MLMLLVVVVFSIWNMLDTEPVNGFHKPWEQAVPLQPVPEGLQSMSAADCGSCHQEHYREWQKSTHALAWVDPQFQAEIAKDNSPYMCINCHAPLQNQQPFVVTGLLEGDIYRPIKHANPDYDSLLRQEGITCAACHVRDGQVVARQVSGRAPHASRADARHLSEQLCISCHNASAVVTPDLVCSFETGDEWRAGPYFGQKTCLDCHMPAVKRPAAAGSDTTMSRLHYFMGSGIPKHDTLTTERLDGLVYDLSGIKTEYGAADSIVLAITVANKVAGHRVPTGDPERFILTVVTIEDTVGRVVQADTFRIGEKWVWYPEAHKVADNNLNPGESRTYQVSARLSPGHFTVRIRGYKFRTTEEMVRYNKLGDDYPTHILFYERTRPLRVIAPA